MVIIFKKIWYLWYQFILFLNKIFVYILLALLFYILITPQSIFRRLFFRKIKNKGLSNRYHIYVSDDLLKPW